ncbi:hypothetical protein AAG570_013119 [Ranatra chinensis]|uniref:Transporter n=1 Tax=Ranatra chinensis TaxID=642074 RepID=A0ABD0YFV6_9HEMI
MASNTTLGRGKWGGRPQFVLSGIGLAIGLGNIWRFPFLCYRNGGGAFLIPYFLCLVTGGIPIFLLEVALGQYTSIGIGTTIICGILNVYYIVILAWAAHYLFYSLQAELPWASCNNTWNSPNCFQGRITNSTLLPAAPVDPIVEYWQNKVLGVSSGIDDWGGFQWELVVALLVVWIIVYFCVWKGIKSSGKVVYVTAIFPYLMLTALFIRGVTLDGAIDGIIFYLKPDFSKLLESQVWIDAGTQIFFSFAIALGCMIALGSYNKFDNNFVSDCMYISTVNCVTSLYSGLAVFSVLGFMAKEQGVPIEMVAESGPGLVFIAYPKAVAQLPWSPVWSALFFLMILLMGVDSQFVGVEGFVTAIVDLYPEILRKPGRKEMFVAAVCIVKFVIGLSMVTKGGIYVFQLFDFFGASGIVLLWFCFFESVSVAYFYGVDKFYDNISQMIGHRMGPWFKFCWLFITPAVTMGILIFTTLQYKPLTYNRTYVYPMWSTALGWTIAIIPMAAIPVYFVYYLFMQQGTLSQVSIKR